MSATPPASAADDDTAAVRRAIAAMKSAYARVQNYTTTVHKQERIRGELLPVEQIELKFAKPQRVYMKWIGEVERGQEVLFVRGWNDSKLRVRKGSFPAVTVDLAPTSKLAMRRSRHAITEAGFGYTIGVIVRDFRRSQDHPEDRARYSLHDLAVHGQSSRCIEQHVPAPAARWYHAARARLCFDIRTAMPTRVTAWDSDGLLLEDYAYADTRLNVGFTDLDFSPTNPAYRF